MKDKTLLEKLKKLAEKEISLSVLCKELNLNTYEILCLVSELKKEGINIATRKLDDDIYLFNRGEGEIKEENNYSFNTDNNNTNNHNEFKFVAISDTRFGSKSQQLSILNDIYSKAYEMGYMNVIHCGNITEGLYPTSNISYNDDPNFLDDTLRQVDYIIKYYPHIEGIQTYFLTGYKDEIHLTKNRINIGKRICDSRSDMIYLGHTSCNVKIDKGSMLIFNPKLSKTYTVSYRPQQQIDSFRSEDKPDILLYGGLLQMEKLPHRNVTCISVPSVCATTKEMNDKRYSNTVGAWYITIKTNEKGLIEKIDAIDSVYYKTNKDDYLKPKVLKLKKEN